MTVQEQFPQRIPTEGLATVKEAHTFLRISRAKVYVMMDKGELESVTLGRCRRIRWQALHNLVEHGLSNGCLRKSQSKTATTGGSSPTSVEHQP